MRNPIQEVFHNADPDPHNCFSIAYLYQVLPSPTPGQNKRKSEETAAKSASAKKGKGAAGSAAKKGVFKR